MKAATSANAFFYTMIKISIHAAREGGDLNAVLITFGRKGFQSTPPVKAATDREVGHELTIDISIHAAREGGDTALLFMGVIGKYFNPRRP